MNSEDLCRRACNCSPAVPEQIRGLSRRELARLFGVGFAAIGLSAIGEYAMAASKTYIACKTTDIKVGSAKIITIPKTKIRVAITQPKKGVFKAFQPICTHQGAQITGISGSNLVCRQHGATFSTTTGAATGGPTRKGLKSYRVTVSGTSVKVTV
jgi:nitrite reductase/ring-hydroxylating ferredoxin subunit